MASSPGPSTPTTTPQRATPINRSFTVPSKLSTPPRPTNTASETDSKEVEVLYIHTSARIIKFSTTSAAKPPPTSTNSPSSRPQSSSGTLPWASPTESLMAAGPLEIYRVPVTGVSFLHSGTFLKPILKRSQCWCVDGVSKFAFTAGPDTYYRIEMPGETAGDLEEVEKLKATLQMVLSYERTACPFKRTFTVDLPEEAVDEGKKKRRRHTGGGVAKKWKLNSAYGWRPEGWEPGMDEPEEGEEEEASPSDEGGSPAGSEEEEGESEADELAEKAKERDVGPSARARAVEKLRSVSAPQQQHPIAHVTSPSRLRTRVDVDGTVEVPPEKEESNVVVGGSREGEVPTLRTFQAIPTDMPPSPPDSSAGLDYLESRAQASNALDAGAALEEEDTEAGAEREDVSAAVDEDVRVESDADDAEGGRNVERGDDVETPLEESEESGETSVIITSGVEREDEDVESIWSATEESTLKGVQQVVAQDGAVQEEALQHAFAPEDSVQEEPVDHPDEIPENISASQRSVIPEDEEQAAPTQTTPPEEHNHSQLEENPSDEDKPATPPPPPKTLSTEDPYAAIQARILARRSLSGTTSFHPLHKSPTRSSTSSTSSSATIVSTRSSLTSRQRRQHQRQGGDVSTSLVDRAYSVFLGPPAHLVAIMLRIAARLANGAFGVNSMFYVASPVGEGRKVPGSYRLRGEGFEEVYSDEEDGDGDGDGEGDEDGEEEGWEDREDDFGVLLDRPASDLSGLGMGVRERRGRTEQVD